MKELLTPEERRELSDLARQEVEKAAPRRSAFVYPTPGVEIAEKSAGGSFSFRQLVHSLATGADSPEMQMVTKALNSTSATEGGFLVPTEQADLLIEELRPDENPIRSLGARVYPCKTATLEIPRLAGGVEAYYTGELAAHDAQDLAFELIRLAPRELIAFVAISNRLIADSSPSAEKAVRSSLARALATAETGAFIRGTGGVAPLGIVHMDGTHVMSPVAGSVLAADDLVDTLTYLRTQFSDATGWLTTPAVFGIVRKLKDHEGRFIFSDPLGADPGKLFGRPVLSTPLCASVDEPTTHYLIATDWSNNVIIADRQTLEISASSHVKFMENLTVVRASKRHDINASHPSAICVLPVTGVA